jgi:hypothetical protein
MADSEQRETGRGPGQDTVPKDLPSVAYFLQLGPPPAFHYFPIILSNTDGLIIDQDPTTSPKPISQQQAPGT